MNSRIDFQEEHIESVFEDEDDEPRGESPAISLFRAFPALQDYLRDIQDPAAQPGYVRRH